MNLIDILPTEIFIHEIFPKMALCDLHSMEMTSNRNKILIQIYIQQLERNLGLTGIRTTKDLIEHLTIRIPSATMIFLNLIQDVKNKIYLLTRYDPNFDYEMISEIELKLKSISFVFFELEWKDLFEMINNRNIIKSSTYSIFHNHAPIQGLTYQNIDERILQRLFPKWFACIKNILKENKISDSDISEINTEINSKIYRLLM
jgi:hypothetical protein